MACCSGKKTDGKELQSIKNESDQSSEKIKPIVAKKSLDSEIEYSITIKTGDNRNSGTDGPVYIKIFGRDNKQTDDILITNSFRQDSVKKVQVKAIDIGKPQRIIIRHEDKTNSWFIDYVEISVHNFLIRFVANRWLSEGKHDRKLSTELFGSEQPAADYNIEIRTGSEQIEPLDSPVYIQIFGTTTQTPKIFLESKYATYTKDSIAKFIISSNNVGEIQKILIGHENLGTTNDWYLESVKIQTAGQQREYVANKWLSPTKDDSQLFLELNYDRHKILMYLITIKTIDIQRTNAIDSIQMSIQGTDGDIDKILLKDFVKNNEHHIFQKDSLNQFEFEQKDIGNIESITIGFDDDDVEQKAALLLESIDIKYKEKAYHFRNDYWLSSRLGANFSWITMKSDTNDDNTLYHVIIETGESGINANVMLCIYGDINITKIYALKNTKMKFDKNSRLEFDLKGNDVGKIEKINIGHDGKNNEEQWFLKTIEIEKKDEHYFFNANRYLNEEVGTFIDLLPEEPKPTIVNNQMTYTITIVTSSENDSGTDSGVFMTIYGDKDRTKKFQLVTNEQNSDLFLFKQNEINQFEMELDDVGKITKINIGQDGKGIHPVWHLQTVEIQKGSDIYKFFADQVLDYSIPDIDLIPIPSKKSSTPISTKPPTPEPTKLSTPRSYASENKVSIKETTYKISARFRSLQKTAINNDANLYMIIVGKNNQTEKLLLLNNVTDEQEFQTDDVGKISKILLGQNKNPQNIVWQVDNITIKHGNDTTIFNVKRSIKQNSEIEVTPSEISRVVVKTREQKESLQMRRSQSARPSSNKKKDDDYEIKTTTGEESSFEGKVIIKLRGEYGIISIPLSQSVSKEKLFQSKATDVFTSRTTDVGKIKRLIIELDDVKTDQTWHLKKIQVIKGNETYNFNADVHFNDRKQKVSLLPVAKVKEDYVQSELRRLRQSLRTTSAKMRRPPHKAHEPFVYNDLRPYFDTTTVEKAIHEPLETPPGYYTRLTALRIVEPWEAYGMDYGVSYELLKGRKSRGYSAKRSTKKTDDETIDRTQGSTYLPEFPCVNIQKPAEYQRPLTLNDVPKIRSFVRNRYTTKANGQIDKDYKRTRDDFYRMQLDNVSDYHETNRDNMIRVYHSYLENTPGSKKALRELCEQIPLNATKTTIEPTV